MIAATYAIPDLLVFIAAAAMVLVGAVGVISFRNPVHSAISLILTLLGVAVAFVEQEAHFLAAVQVIVYAGAIVVLFLFVIMFLGIDEREDVSVEPLIGQRPLAYASVLVTVGGILAMLSRGGWVTGAQTVTGPTEVMNGTTPDNVMAVGQSVFTTYLFAFEATAALLIIAVVGAVLLARRERVTEEGVEVA
jgi:NADH-quinone oxidoreductase subunit J